MRSAGGTKSDDFSLVTFCTNSTMAFFASVSRHEARGSAAKADEQRTKANKQMRSGKWFIKLTD
jgi:hypothetical protein